MSFCRQKGVGCRRCSYISCTFIEKKGNKGEGATPLPFPIPFYRDVGYTAYTLHLFNPECTLFIAFMFPASKFKGMGKLSKDNFLLGFILNFGKDVNEFIIFRLPVHTFNNFNEDGFIGMLFLFFDSIIF